MLAIPSVFHITTENPSPTMAGKVHVCFPVNYTKSGGQTWWSNMVDKLGGHTINHGGQTWWTDLVDKLVGHSSKCGEECTCVTWWWKHFDNGITGNRRLVTTGASKDSSPLFISTVNPLGSRCTTTATSTWLSQDLLRNHRDSHPMCLKIGSCTMPS